MERNENKQSANVYDLARNYLIVVVAMQIVLMDGENHLVQRIYYLQKIDERYPKQSRSISHFHLLMSKESDQNNLSKAVVLIYLNCYHDHDSQPKERIYLPNQDFHQANSYQYKDICKN
jgi:hypothetical protein